MDNFIQLLSQTVNEEKNLIKQNNSFRGPFTDIYEKECKDLIEKHRNYVRNEFKKNAPTYEYISEHAKESRRLNVFWGNIAYYSIIGQSRPHYFNNNSYPRFSESDELNNKIMKTTCEDVYKMMNKLNKENNWNLKVKKEIYNDRTCEIDILW